MKTGNRIPSLDGLRAVSITLVLVSHLAGTRNFPTALTTSETLGYLGVKVFFVISGFLITSLLLKEHAKNGQISLRAFYLRRIFRIFPASYVFVAVMFLCAVSGLITLLPNDLLHANTYSMNYHRPHAWYMAHLWSLAVEEQFYFMWPAILFFAGPRRAFKTAAGVVVLVPLIRMAMWYAGPAYRAGIGHEFQSVADALAIGCVLAGVRGWLAGKQWYLRLLESPAFAAVPVAALVLYLLGSEHPRIYYFAGETLVNVATALTIDRFIRFPTGFVGRLLNSPPLVFVGVLSYSLYLWQQPFLNRASHSLVAAFPYNVLLAFCAALLSYFLVEKPFLALKDRIEACYAQPKKQYVGAAAAD